MKFVLSEKRKLSDLKYLCSNDFSVEWMGTPNENTRYLHRLAGIYAFENGRDLENDVMKDKELFSKGVTFIDIGFESLLEQHVNEARADALSSLVSDMGGQLGLWIGLSMISLLEVFYCLFYYCKRFGKAPLDKVGPQLGT